MGKTYVQGGVQDRQWRKMKSQWLKEKFRDAETKIINTLDTFTHSKLPSEDDLIIGIFTPDGYPHIVIMQTESMKTYIITDIKYLKNNYFKLKFSSYHCPIFRYNTEYLGNKEYSIPSITASGKETLSVLSSDAILYALIDHKLSIDATTLWVRLNRYPELYVPKDSDKLTYCPKHIWAPVFDVEFIHNREVWKRTVHISTLYAWLLNTEDYDLIQEPKFDHTHSLGLGDVSEWHKFTKKEGLTKNWMDPLRFPNWYKPGCASISFAKKVIEESPFIK